ncbi:MAG: amidohydrolase/deacetylase family metallohydrolase [Terriglobia bacterium]
MGSSLVLAAAPALGASDSTPTAEGPVADPYDLLIKGGKVIDPSQRINAVMDVALVFGKVARLAPDISPNRARRVISAAGKIVVPGLIDIHCHVFPYVGPYGIQADPHCVHRGVTTVVDAGTSGYFTFPAFRRYDIDTASTRIRALLHIVSIGMVTGSTPNMGELEDLRYCVPKLAVERAQQDPDVIVGFKVRCSKKYTGPNDLEGTKRVREAADEAGLPFMMHIGGPYSPLPELLALMKKGDIVTHCFNWHPHGILDSNGKLLPAAVEARERGVRFDVGHGAGSFSFDIAEKCMDQGFLPDTISTDLYMADLHGPVYDLPTTMSKFLLLGMPLPEVIQRTTLNAAESFRFREQIGTLKPGSEGDVSILEIQEGNFSFTDSAHSVRQGRQRLAPVVTIRAGKVFYPSAESSSPERI